MRNESDYQLGWTVIRALEPIPGADKIELASLDKKGLPFLYPVVVQKGTFVVGDKAFYIPVDSVLPPEPEFSFLGSDQKRLRAKRLRGVYSEGLLMTLDEIRGIGIRRDGNLGIHRYTETRNVAGRQVAGPFAQDLVYGVENIRKGSRAWDELKPDDGVVVTEKLHGSNVRFCKTDGKNGEAPKYWVGSHRTWRDLDCAGDPYVELTRGLWENDRLNGFEDYVFYGEMIGHGVQDLTYGHTEKAFRLFDVWETTKQRFVDWGSLQNFAKTLGFNLAPVLYHGPRSEVNLAVLAEGKTTLSGANHVREGVVAKSYDGVFRGKFVGEGYKLRKNATDFVDSEPPAAEADKAAA